ncbi:hypothetical protein GUITHDRAFT_134144 [Guillardia theta CCMP2712]|uniref:RUN domain-containing protein n=1 Tax=Guillardia theta (strain CCMP2712) TaxID=905079 RepID=L1JUP0_GUITC|nr:hypothetical protein GUITHDRAFT_134144 [Guillardia theta CCMP2712]EKX51788.1 hypothetical protein GUITHDRAFT_134144 [Guillardia theta CCMP2712]|eukprot:XP_005838768.1 hypothetical protein GUITHDRAFT_134144 [Guillardia theta CCMP2712]
MDLMHGWVESATIRTKTMSAAAGSLDLAILFQDATGLLYTNGGKEARRKMEEQRSEARQQERTMLLQRLKKAVQGVFALVIKAEDDDVEADARGRREVGSKTRLLYSATREVVWSVYNIFMHGLIKTGFNEDPVWSLLKQIVAAVPSIQLNLLMLQNQPSIKTQRGKACAFLHMAIADKSLEEIIEFCDILGLKEDRYEEWSFMRDLETHNTLPTLIVGLAQVDLSFDWMVTDEYATELKRKEPCSVWGHGGLAPIPEEDEHLVQRRVQVRPVRTKAKSKVVSIDKMDESDGHLSPVDVSKLIDSINLSVDVSEALGHIPEMHEDEQSSSFQCDDNCPMVGDWNSTFEVPMTTEPPLDDNRTVDFNVSPVLQELDRSENDCDHYLNLESPLTGRIQLGQHVSSLVSDSLFSSPAPANRDNGAGSEIVNDRTVHKDEIEENHESSDYSWEPNASQLLAAGDGTAGMFETPADRRPHLEVSQDFKELDTGAVFSMRVKSKQEQVGLNGGVCTATPDTWEEEDGVCDRNQTYHGSQGQLESSAAQHNSSSMDRSWGESSIASTRDLSDREVSAAAREPDVHRSRDSGSAESSTRSLRFLDEQPAFEPGLITTEEAASSRLFPASNVCAACGDKVGTGFLGNARFCNYTRTYFCPRCHVNEKSVIISKVLKRWDFTPRNVSSAAKAYLQGIYEQPLFSAAMDIPPSLQQRVKQLEQIRDLRRKAKILRDYVVQCSNFPNSRCQQEDRIAAVHLHDRDYLVADDDSLSLRDLEEINNGILKTFLESTIEPWMEHVTRRCLLCREKGYVCEICNSKEIIFPFELEKEVLADRKDQAEETADKVIVRQGPSSQCPPGQLNL